MSLRFPLLLLGGLLGLSVLVAIVALNVPASSSYLSYPNYTTSSPSAVGTVTSNLGTRADLYGSKWQAIELLKLFNANPNTARIVITASSNTGERLELIVDRSADTLERKHWDADGTGTSSLWKGSLQSRLQEAITGDGFNYGSGSTRGPNFRSI